VLVKGVIDVLWEEVLELVACVSSAEESLTRIGSELFD